MSSFSLAPTAPTETLPWQLTWNELPPVPSSPGEAGQAGLAAPFVGIHQGALLVAGGANFPGRPPWAGGVKKIWNDVFVLTKQGGGSYRWITNPDFKLPRALAYGMSFNTPEGIVCVGGADSEQCYADVFLLSWNPAARSVTTTPWPSLPKPLAFMGGTQLGSVIYVLGGQSTLKDPQFVACFWALDLAKKGLPGFGWTELPAWPGPARILPVVAAQTDGRNERIYLFSGRLPQAGSSAALLSDGYAFDPASQQWTTVASPRSGHTSACLMGATAVTAGDDILVMGGDRGDLFGVLEAHDLKVAELRRQQSLDGADQGQLQQRIDAELAAKIKIYENHPGFSHEILAYNPRSNTWRVVGTMPLPSPVTTLATRWDDEWVIPNGEIRPGIRTPGVFRVKLSPSTVPARGKSN